MRTKRNKEACAAQVCANVNLSFLICKMLIKILPMTSLMVQWIRTCLLMQGTQIQSLVWEDSASQGATRPMCHSH